MACNRKLRKLLKKRQKEKKRSNAGVDIRFARIKGRDGPSFIVYLWVSKEHNTPARESLQKGDRAQCCIAFERFDGRLYPLGKIEVRAESNRQKIHIHDADEEGIWSTDFDVNMDGEENEECDIDCSPIEGKKVGMERISSIWDSDDFLSAVRLGVNIEVN